MATVPGPPDLKQLATHFEETIHQMVDCYNELRSMQLGPLKANIALEYSRDAQKYLDAVEASELREQCRRLDQAHKYATDVLKRVKKPAEVLLKFCKDIRSDWEVERRNRIEAERRRREEEANRLAAAARQAELEHLQKIGKSAEAAAKAAEPLPSITVNVNEDAGKPEGEMFVEVWMPKLDDQGNICFSDEPAYRKWNAERPEFYYLMKHEYGKLKKLLSDNRGMLQPPGLEIEHKWEPRTRREPDE